MRRFQAPVRLRLLLSLLRGLAQNPSLVQVLLILTTALSMLIKKEDGRLPLK